MHTTSMPRCEYGNLATAKVTRPIFAATNCSCPLMQSQGVQSQVVVFTLLAALHFIVDKYAQSSLFRDANSLTC